MAVRAVCGSPQRVHAVGLAVLVRATIRRAASRLKVSVTPCFGGVHLWSAGITDTFTRTGSGAHEDVPATKDRHPVSETAGDQAENQVEHTEQAYREQADAGDLEAAFRLGRLLHERGVRSEAEHWYVRAAGGGHAQAANALGVLLEEHGSADEAERWYRRAAEAGDPNGVYNLGLFLEGAGSAEEAGRWYQQAAVTGDMEAVERLATIALKQGDGEAALRHFRTAAEQGNDSAAFKLAVLLQHGDDPAGARPWFEQAAEGGNLAAAVALGRACLLLGDESAAERWWRQAADAGEVRASVALGSLLARRGDLPEAERHFRAAAESGQARAALALGELLEQRGDADAERWWRQAAAAGEPIAALRVGQRLHARGDREEAERWFRESATAGVVTAADALGMLLLIGGADAEAEPWLRRAAEGGSSLGAQHLALLLEKRGAKDDAERWWRQAAEAGDPEAARTLGALLLERGAEEEAWYWLERGGQRTAWPLLVADPEQAEEGVAEELGPLPFDPAEEPPPAASFRDLLAEHAATSIAKQRAFKEWLGDHTWMIDLAEGTVNFEHDRVFRMQVLGTESQIDHSWLWAWANEISKPPPQVLEAAERLRALGEAEGIEELRRPGYHLAEAGGHLLSLVASGVCGADAYYRGRHESTAVYFLVFATPVREQAPAPVEQVLATLTQALARLDVDHRRLVWHFLRQQGFELRTEGRALVATSGERELAVRFNAAGRVVRARPVG
jgi:TPR repeat protein